MMATILKFALSVVLAVAGSMAGQRWITYLYASAPDILDKPYRVAENTKKRQSFLTMSLGFLLCFAHGECLAQRDDRHLFLRAVQRDGLGAACDL